MDSSSTHNEYVLRLKLPIPHDINLSRKTKTIGIHHGVIRNYISRKYLNNVLKLLPKEIQDCCMSISKSTVRPVPVHVHKVESCVINFYFNTNREETSFYEGTYNTTYEDDYFKLLDPKELKKVDSFIANNGDVYLLNSRKPHDVVNTKTVDDARLLIQVFLNKDFLEVKKILEKNGIA